MGDEKLWYFAYGANMNPAVLTGRRKVQPSQSKGAFAPGYYLNFAAIAIPYKEPSFASIGPQAILPSQPVVHGVVHEITRRDYQRIRRTEGGGGHEGVGYASREIQLETYDGEVIRASTLVHCSNLTENRKFFPSARYMNLIQRGATDFGLREDYQEWLKSVPRYLPSSSLRHWMGRIIFLSLLALTGGPIIGAMVVGRLTQRRPPRGVYVAASWMIGILANVYHFVFRPIFGCGAGEEEEIVKGKYNLD